MWRHNDLQHSGGGAVFDSYVRASIGGINYCTPAGTATPLIPMNVGTMVALRELEQDACEFRAAQRQWDSEYITQTLKCQKSKNTAHEKESRDICAAARVKHIVDEICDSQLPLADVPLVNEPPPSYASALVYSPPKRLSRWKRFLKWLCGGRKRRKGASARFGRRCHVDGKFKR